MAAPVSISDGPPVEGWTQLIAPDASGNPLYVGLARSLQPEYTLVVTSVSKAVDAAFGITGHGLKVDNGITISGATGDWAALNGTHPVKAVSDANTVTIEADTTGFSGSFDGVVKSRAPRTNANVWSLRKFYYTDSKLDREAHAHGNTSCDKVWDSKTTYWCQ